MTDEGNPLVKAPRCSCRGNERSQAREGGQGWLDGCRAPCGENARPHLRPREPRMRPRERRVGGDG